MAGGLVGALRFFLSPRLKALLRAKLTSLTRASCLFCARGKKRVWCGKDVGVLGESSGWACGPKVGMTERPRLRATNGDVDVGVGACWLGLCAETGMGGRVWVEGGGGEGIANGGDPRSPDLKLRAAGGVQRVLRVQRQEMRVGVLSRDETSRCGGM